MKKNEREILIGENRISLEENNMVRLIIIGEIDEEIANRINEASLKLVNMVEGKVNVLIDLNKTGKTSTAARKKQKEISELEKWRKIALFGLHPVARVLAAFYIGISRNKNQRFFKTEEEALKWLKE
jgi:hypothetical protein